VEKKYSRKNKIFQKKKIILEFGGPDSRKKILASFFLAF
jgi:hypothetical protein